MGTAPPAIVLLRNGSAMVLLRAESAGGPDRRIVIELDAERERARYRVRIIEGDGAGTEIWTLLAMRDADRTAVEVRFYLPRKETASTMCRQEAALKGYQDRHSASRFPSWASSARSRWCLFALFEAVAHPWRPSCS
jgi:hypothetical protein